MNKLIWIFLAATVLVSCSDDNFTIEGKITNSQASMIYLEKLEINGSTPVDSAKIDNKGMFRLSGAVGYPTFFLLKLSDQKIITLLVDSLEEVSIAADYLNFSKDYKVEGSLGSQKVKQLNDHLTQTNTSIDSLKSLITLSVNERDYAQKREQWIREIESVYEKQEEFSKNFIAENPFSMASVLAIYQKFNDNNYVVQDLQSLKMAASALYSMYPRSVHAQTLYKNVEGLMKDIKAQEMREFINQYGQNSPEVVLPDPKGNDVALSSLQGKYVLVHFWASFDRSSRVMNSVLAENYREFRNKGFEIYQISVDSSRTEWTKAIADDQLRWINVGDMRGSNDAVNNYNITQIPANYLLDKEGAIVAKDLKGPALHRTLNELLN